jgi:hypothetical protein
MTAVSYWEDLITLFLMSLIGVSISNIQLLERRGAVECKSGIATFNGDNTQKGSWFQRIIMVVPFLIRVLNSWSLVCRSDEVEVLQCINRE